MDKLNYPDPQEHLNRHIDQAAQRYVFAVEEGVLQPSERLEQAIAVRTLLEARESYVQESNEILKHNVSIIEQRYRERNNAIKRSGARMRLWCCPLLATALGLFAWACFAQSIWLMGWIYTAGALAFLGMLVGGWIVDRPEQEVK